MQVEATIKTSPVSAHEPATSAIPGWVAVGIALLAVYASTLKWMVDAWMLPESNYSPGFWVPLVIGYFLWEKRDELAALPKRRDGRGLNWIAGALIVHLAATLLDVHFLSGLSLIPLALGLVLYYAGPYTMRRCFWPFVFIVFMVPLPWIQSSLTIRFQYVSAAAAAHLLTFGGLETLRDGTILTMPNFKLFVEAPCSGLNTLFSLMFVGSVVAYLARGVWWRKAVLLASAIPIAVAANILRIVIIGLLGEFYGTDVAMGVFHNWSGIIMYSAALALFLFEAWVLRVKFTNVEARA
ncbi:MAG: exosortase [Armatimonadetes bacterium]|nr:exosortase [Armatimonadota bacterium]